MKENRDSKRSRYIPADIKRAVFLRDQGKCTYVNPKNGLCCESEFGLEYEHTHPFALDGEHSIDNLTLRCKANNLLAAMEVFGMGG